VAGFVFRFPYFQATKMTPEKNRFMVKLKLKPFFWGDEKATHRGQSSNGFKSDQRSHNNQNLLNDLFSLLFMGWKHEKSLFISAKNKEDWKESLPKEIKSEQGRSAIFSDIYGSRWRDIWCCLNRWNIERIKVPTSLLNHGGIPCK
jgi:hypothetical protein